MTAITSRLPPPPSDAGPRQRTNLWRYAAPREAYALARQLTPGLLLLAAVALSAGLTTGLALAPPDQRQGEVYRILYLHVPAAWLSLWIYPMMAGWSAAALVLRTRCSALMAQALAPTGALLTLVTLLTGALWGRPTWGVWWVWDARLSAEFVLLLLYLGVIALRHALPDPQRAARAAQLLSVAGVVHLPIIHWSVDWWQTLHQGASITLGAAPRMGGSMLAATLLMALGCWALAAAVTLTRFRLLLRDHAHQRAALARALSAGASA